MDPPRDAAVLAVDLKPLLKIAADRDLEVEMAQRAVREVDDDEPAIGAETLEQPGAERPRSALPETAHVSTRWLP